MDNKLNITIVYESKSYILSKFTGSEDYLYHWREDDEIFAIKDALIELGHDITLCDGLEEFLVHNNNFSIDLVWNLSIRVKSRNRTALGSSLFEILDIPYTGGDALTKALCLNKDILKPLLTHSHIKTPNFSVIDHEDSFSISFDNFIIKPVCEGYSVGIQKFSAKDDIKMIKNHIKEIRVSLDCRILVEEFVYGQEVTLAFIDETDCFSALACNMNPSKILTLSEKRFKQTPKETLNEDFELMEKLKEIYYRTREVVGFLGYGTMDFRITESNKIYLIDVNADATLHPERSFSQSFLEAGLSYQEMIKKILTGVNFTSH